MIRVTKVWGLDFSWTPALVPGPTTSYAPVPNYFLVTPAPITFLRPLPRYLRWK